MLMIQVKAAACFLMHTNGIYEGFTSTESVPLPSFSLICFPFARDSTHLTAPRKQLHPPKNIHDLPGVIRTHSGKTNYRSPHEAEMTNYDERLPRHCRGVYITGRQMEVE